MIRNCRNQLLAACGVLLIVGSCNTPENNVDTQIASASAKPTKTPVKNTSNTDIRFICTLDDTKEYGDNFLIDLSCVLVNESEKDVNYICESCNGLEYFVVTQPDNYETMPDMNCNASWGMTAQIKAGDSIEFKTHLLKFKDALPIRKIGLDFRVVDQLIPFEETKNQPELIKDVYHAKTEDKNILWCTNF